MWWKLFLKSVLYVAKKPAVQQWARTQARKAVERMRRRTEKKAAIIYASVGLDPAPKPKLSTLVRTDRDILRPGMVVVQDGRALRVARLISSNVKETVYEAVDA